MRRPLLCLLVLLVISVGCADDPELSTSAAVTTEPPLDGASLSTAWPCGHGFHQSDGAQTTALMLDMTDRTWTEAPAQVTTLPDPGWDARVVVGEHLFANWCDDLVDGDDPTPRTDETWPVVAGTITFVDDAAAVPTGCTQPVVAHVAGLVAERPDGTSVALEDRDVRNSCWGGAAG